MGVAGPKTKKPSAMAGLQDLVMCCCMRPSITTRKIDMMGLIYGQSANWSSGIYKDLLTVEYLGRVNHSLLFEPLQALVNSASPVAPGSLR